jgi:hypothetical protein
MQEVYRQLERGGESFSGSFCLKTQVIEKGLSPRPRFYSAFISTSIRGFGNMRNILRNSGLESLKFL